MAQSLLEREPTEAHLSAASDRPESEAHTSTEANGRSFVDACGIDHALIQEDASKRQGSASRNLLTRILKRPTSLTPDFESTITVEPHSATPSSPVVDARSGRRPPFFNVSIARPPHQESYAKMPQDDNDDDASARPEPRTPLHQQPAAMYNIHENLHATNETHNGNAPTSDGGHEMILTAATLTPIVVPATSSPAASLPTDSTRC